MNKIYIPIIFIGMIILSILYYNTDITRQNSKDLRQKKEIVRAKEKSKELQEKISKYVEEEPQVIYKKPIEIKDQQISVEEASLNLLEAIGNNDYEKAKEALKNKADPNYTVTDANNDQRPLFLTAISQKASPDIIDLLIKYGANIKTEKGKQPFLSSVMYFKPSDEVLSILAKRGVDIDAQDSSNYIPLLHAMKLKDTKEAFRISKKLLELGANPNREYTMADGYKVNLLFFAITENLDLSIIELLIKHGANVNPNHNKSSFLIELIDRDIPDEVLKLLIKSGMDFNNKLLINAILLEETSRAIKISNKLIDLGADPNCKISAYNRATKKTEPISLLYYAIIKDVEIEIINLLIKNGADINANINNIPLIYLIISNGFSNEILETIIKAGVDINGYIYSNLTPLAVALFKSKDSDTYRISKKLIELGSDTNKKLHLLNKRTNKKDTVSLLYLAVMQKLDYKLVELLVNNKANVNDKVNGKSIIEYAKYIKVPDNISKLLINAKLKTKGLHY